MCGNLMYEEKDIQASDGNACNHIVLFLAWHMYILKLKSHFLNPVFTVIPHFIALHFLVFCRYCTFFTDWRFVAPCVKQVTQHHLSNAFAHLVSLCQSGNSSNVPNLCVFIIFFMVICDHWLLCLFGGTMNHTHIRWRTWCISCVFWLLCQPVVPPAQASLFPETQQS